MMFKRVHDQIYVLSEEDSHWLTLSKAANQGKDQTPPQRNTCNNRNSNSWTNLAIDDAHAVLNQATVASPLGA